MCTVDCPWLDGKHVVFGSVVDGMDVVQELEKLGSPSGKTKTVRRRESQIQDCCCRRQIYMYAHRGERER